MMLAQKIMFYYGFIFVDGLLKMSYLSALFQEHKQNKSVQNKVYNKKTFFSGVKTARLSSTR